MEYPYIQYSGKPNSLRGNVFKAVAEQNAKMQMQHSIMEKRQALDKFSDLRTIAIRQQTKFMPVGHIPCELVFQDACPQKQLILYIHGGGFVNGDRKTARPYASHICESAEIQVLTVEYSLAPEHPFPAALLECLRVYKGLLKQGYLHKNIAFFGDSAGGNLILAMALALKEDGEKLPACITCASPVTDMTGDSHMQRQQHPLLFFSNPSGTLNIFDAYAGKAPLSNPLLSPSYGNLTGLPPILIHTGEAEPLTEDCIRFAHKVHRAGSPILLKIWRGMFHDFTGVGRTLPESRESVKEITDFIKTCMATTAEDR